MKGKYSDTSLTEVVYGFHTIIWQLCHILGMNEWIAQINGGVSDTWMIVYFRPKDHYVKLTHLIEYSDNMIGKCHCSKNAQPYEKALIQIYDSLKLSSQNNWIAWPRFINKPVYV